MLRWALVMCALSFPAAQSARAGYFLPLGRLQGDSISIATDVSADGSLVVGFSGSGCCAGWAFEGDAFKWTSAEGMLGLVVSQTVAGVALTGTAVSADSSTIVGSEPTANRWEAFRWTSADGMSGLGDLPGGGFISSARGVSADGSVIVGWSSSANGLEAFRWTTADGMSGLGDLPGGDFSSQAHGVSADGAVVVGTSHSANGLEAFRWTSVEGMSGLGDLPGGDFDSSANGVSADGSIIVGYSVISDDFEREAFRWTSEGGMVGLGDLPGGTYQSSATDVSSDGSVVVGWSNSTTGQQAVVWDTKHGMRPLAAVLTSQGIDLSGWWLTAASAISADGNTIVGSGINPLGQTEAWLANISTVPEPGTVSVLFVGALVFAACYRPTNFRQMATLQGQDS